MNDRLVSRSVHTVPPAVAPDVPLEREPHAEAADHEKETQIHAMLRERFEALDMEWDLPFHMRMNSERYHNAW